MRRVTALLLVFGAMAAPAGAATSFADVEDEVMCVSCNVPLNVAESPQADAERAEIRALIEKGLSKQQIKDALVAEYGDAVLAQPKDDGFGLAAYLVPIAVALGLIALAAFLLPRWRARTASGTAAAPAPTLTAEQRERLQADLDGSDA